MSLKKGMNMVRLRLNQISLGVITLLFSCFLYAQEDLTPLKRISGKITYLNGPLPDVNITIGGTTKGTKTDVKGNYNIEAKIGDVIRYSYVGFNTVSIIVEDVTFTLNIEMTQKINELDETVVIARKKAGKISEIAAKKNKKIQTAVGLINLKGIATKVNYVKGEDILPIYPSLSAALRGKFTGTLPSIWDVDGQIFHEEPPINLSQIKDVYILTKHIGTTRWGGPVVIVRTINSSFKDIKEKRKQKAEQYTNQNYYNNDAVVINDVTTFSSNSAITQNKKAIQKNISGKVTYLDTLLVNVNIIVVGKTIGTKTNTKGYYTIKANVGDIIQYSYLGYATVSIIVEDVTEVLDIEMVIKENVLDEVTVTADGKIGKVLERAKKAEEKFESAMGTINPKTAGYAISYINGEEIKPIYSTLGEALGGKMAGVRYDYVSKKLIVKPATSINNAPLPLWDVDGQIFTEEPPLDLNNIKSVHILKTLAGTNRYGSAGAGGVVVVRTNYGSFDPLEAKSKKVAEQYTNKNYYSNDALIINLENLNSNSFADALEAFNSKQKAFIYYDQTLKNLVKSYSDHISIAQKFITFYKDENLAREVFNKVTETYNKNPEILKAVAYHLQALGLKGDAINTYEQVFKLRPKYAQSYRDLANAYVENDQYKKAWRLYMSYLIQGNDVSGEGIGQTLYNEMEFLYYNRSFQTAIKETFIPKSEDLLDFRNDVRIVFEWNTSEAEFNLEFVNPEKRAYVFEHSLAANQELITNEKQKGYSSKDFFINDIGNGEWLINISYKGNKKPEPTYFKVTQYFNWGKSNQTKEITVYKFKNEREKIQLIKLNKQFLVTTN